MFANYQRHVYTPRGFLKIIQNIFFVNFLTIYTEGEKDKNRQQSIFFHQGEAFLW